MPDQSVSECGTGELAVPVAVENHTDGRLKHLEAIPDNADIAG